MKAVFHHSDSEQHAQIVGNVENLLADETIDLDAVALVANSGGLGLLTDDSEYRGEILELQDQGVAFKQCENTLDGTDVTADDLLPGVELVSSGVGELTRLQADGYAYISP